MRNKITFFVLSASGSPVQATASRSLLVILCFFVFALFCCGAAGLYYGVEDYRRCKIKADKTIELARKLDERGYTITFQKNQIKNLAKEINTLKSGLSELRDFEKRIRVFANLTKNNEEESGLFGVGGSLPEDIDPTEQLEENYNSLIREMHNQVEQLDRAAVYGKEGFESLLKGLEEQRNLLACTPSVRPSKGYTTSRFGYRKSPFTGMREFHKGLDISARTGTPVYATADGVVSSATVKGLLGKTIVIDHGHGMVTRFAHLSKYLIKEGDKVKRGEIIGHVGNTGRSTGPHVHYEVHLNGIPVNPEYYILN